MKKLIKIKIKSIVLLLLLTSGCIRPINSDYLQKNIGKDSTEITNIVYSPTEGYLVASGNSILKLPPEIMIDYTLGDHITYEVVENLAEKRDRSNTILSCIMVLALATLFGVMYLLRKIK